MTKEEFVSSIHKTVVEDSTSMYRAMYEKADASKAADEFGRKAILFYQHLSVEDREVLLGIMRQVTVDSVSQIFGVLDGSSWLDSQDSDFCLSQEKDRFTLLNGDLQGTFLEKEEDGQ